MQPARSPQASMLAAAVLLCRAAAVLLLCRAASSTSSAQPTGGVTTLDCASAIAIAAEARAFSRASVRIVLSASVRLFAATVVAVATFATTRVVEPPPRGLSPGGAFPATVADEMTVACCPPGACLDSVTCDVAMQLPARARRGRHECRLLALRGEGVGWMRPLSPARRVVVGIVCAPPNAPTSRDARVAADVAPPPPPPAELLACAVEAVFGTAMELEHPADARRGVAAPPPPPAAAAFPFAAAAFAARSALNDATVGFSAGAGFAALLLLLLLVACR